MPNRIIREGILTSERVNSLSPNAELFYRRLMSVVDDYGRFSANPTLLRASCYPLKLDSVKEDSIKKHLAECVDAGLIVLYTVAGKAFLELQDFRQQVRAKESKYPSPGGHVSSTCVADAQHPLSDAHLDVVVVGDDKTTLSGEPDAPPHDREKPAPTHIQTAQPSEAFMRFWTAWPNTARKADRKKCWDKWRSKRLEPLVDVIVAHVEACRERNPQWRDGFEPAPLTYLNGERWNDGVPPGASPQRSREVSL